MYTRLNSNRTKIYYRNIINNVIEETEKYCLQFPSISVYKVILEQLIDIKENIILKNKVFTENEIYNRYNIGAIAVKNFDLEHEEYAQRLSDIFGGSFDYHEMSEG